MTTKLMRITEKVDKLIEKNRHYPNEPKWYILEIMLGLRKDA